MDIWFYFFKINCLDFISDSPKLFIFQKQSNKTNLGGIFFFIYLILVILIFIFYIYDYKKKEKFTFSNAFIEDLVFSDEEERRLNSLEYNPVLNFSFDILDANEKSLDERFFIMTPNTLIIDRNRIYQRQIHNIELIIGFNCRVKYCKDFNITNLPRTNYFYYFRIRYNGPFINHYGEESPILNISGNNFIRKDYTFGFNNFFRTKLIWSPIEYYDEIGIIDKIKGKKSKYYAGDIELYDSFIVDEELNPIINKYRYMTDIKFLSAISIYVQYGKKTKYTRYRKNIWDTFGIIFSLCSTLYTIMKFIFLNIYLNHFEPDKIIEQILCNNYKINSIDEFKRKNNSGKIELSLNSPKEIILDKNIINDDNVINEKNLLDDINNDEEEEIILPKFRMIHYLLNNIYSLKKWKSNKQEIITLCKEILLKYVSIDYLLLNQIKFENLMKDYKWNNPKLKDIKTNELISKLKDKIDFEKFNI